jgi:hypothetical protein
VKLNTLAKATQPKYGTIKRPAAIDLGQDAMVVAVNDEAHNLSHHFFANSASRIFTTSGASGVVRGEKRATWGGPSYQEVVSWLLPSSVVPRSLPPRGTNRSCGCYP